MRDRTDRTKVVRAIGGEQLTLKTMWRMLENTVYAGTNPEKWTQGKPVKCMFDGLVSIELFNAANRGRLFILEDETGVRIHRREVPAYLANKGARNADFPYKRIVMCPECHKPLYGSASRGKLGKYYAAYHCDHRGHYFRKQKKELDQTIEAFVKSLRVSPEYIDELLSNVADAFDKQQLVVHQDAVAIDLRITDLRNQVGRAVDKIKFLSSETAIRYMEADIIKLEAEIAELTAEKQKTAPQEAVDINKLSAYVRYYLEHLDELLLHHCNPVLQARYFGVIFNVAPTYDDLCLEPLISRKYQG